jgi:hypothetical protein
MLATLLVQYNILKLFLQIQLVQLLTMASATMEQEYLQHLLAIMTQQGRLGGPLQSLTQLLKQKYSFSDMTPI